MTHAQMTVAVMAGRLMLGVVPTPFTARGFVLIFVHPLSAPTGKDVPPLI
jgi:hypothetical protein